MSLLEDIFLQDEANEAQELERIIEGDEFEGGPRSDSDNNSEKEDEAEEDKRKVDPASTKTRRIIKNPRFTLNPARLTGPRGIQVLPDHFKDFKFKGKGHEKEDLDLVLKKLEHWAYRLYPKFQFEDCLKKIETLGKKRPVMVHLHKIRTDQYLSEETVVQKDSSEDEAPQDEFDKLLQQQIDLARSTPHSTRKDSLENRPLIMPKATSSPSISDEQKERMLRNRKLAEERRLARLKNISNNTSQNILNTDTLINTVLEEDTVTIKKNTNLIQEDNDGINVNINSIDNNETLAKRHKKYYVIVSSDEEDIVINESINADVHIENVSNENDNSKDDKDEQSTENYNDNIDTSKINDQINIDSENSIEIGDNSKHNNKSVELDKFSIKISEINEQMNNNNENIIENKDNSKDKSIHDEDKLDNIETPVLNKESSKIDKGLNSNDKNDVDDENIELMDIDFGDDF